ncbi:MAG: sulfotransferase [Bacteroidales bacterium]|nr:sulfotransferase [Bacteroidales bacterium]
MKHNELDKLEYWAEKTPLNELYTNKILKFYSDAKFINIVRDPIQNIISLKHLHKIRNRKSRIETLSLFQVFLYEKTLKNSRTIKDYKIITYEDMLSNTKPIMKNLCTYLNIQYSDSLTVPTINSLPATANSMFKNKRQTREIVKNKGIKKPENEFNKKELFVLVNTLYMNRNFRKIIHRKYPEMITYKKPLLLLFAKLSFYLYKIYRFLFK